AQYRSGQGDTLQAGVTEVAPLQMHARGAAPGDHRAGQPGAAEVHAVQCAVREGDVVQVDVTRPQPGQVATDQLDPLAVRGQLVQVSGGQSLVGAGRHTPDPDRAVRRRSLTTPGPGCAEPDRRTRREVRDLTRDC